MDLGGKQLGQAGQVGSPRLPKSTDATERVGVPAPWVLTLIEVLSGEFVLPGRTSDAFLALLLLVVRPNGFRCSIWSVKDPDPLVYRVDCLQRACVVFCHCLVQAFLVVHGSLGSPAFLPLCLLLS